MMTCFFSSVYFSFMHLSPVSKDSSRYNKARTWWLLLDTMAQRYVFMASTFEWVYSTWNTKIFIYQIFSLNIFIVCFFPLYIARNWDADAAEKMLREVCLKQSNTENYLLNVWKMKREWKKVYCNSITHHKFYLNRSFFLLLFFSQSMKWRERWNVDNILDWKTPQALDEYSPHGISGFDKEGSPSNFTYRHSFTFSIQMAF